MPTYDYECTECGEVFELFQPITASPKRRVKPEDKNCSCDAPVKRRIGAGAGIIFKGSGFYQTDYRSEGYRKAANADKAAATSGSSSSTDSTAKDSKPASSKESATPKTGKDGGKSNVSKCA